MAFFPFYIFSKTCYYNYYRRVSKPFQKRFKTFQIYYTEEKDMNYVDLHVHSNASDGTLSPEEVVRYAASKQLKAMALTDHDTIAGITQAKTAAAECGIELIPGIELSCFYQATEIHILGFFIDEHSEVLNEGLKHLVDIRTRRNEVMLKRFQDDGFQFTLEDLTGGNPDTVITRAHFARVLVDKGYAPNMGKAFDKYLQYGGKYCMRKEVVTPAQAMKLLTSSGAWPCLAHPMQYHLGYDQIRVLVGSLKEQGLRGLEVYHSSQNPYQSSKLREIAREFGLLPSGGSDFHGSNKPDIDIGVGRGGLRISYALLKDIKEDYYGRTVSND